MFRKGLHPVHPSSEMAGPSLHKLWYTTALQYTTVDHSDGPCTIRCTLHVGTRALATCSTLLRTLINSLSAGTGVVTNVG